MAPAGISGATPSPSSSAAATAAAAAAASEREAGPDAQAQRLQHIFELASTSTQVDHPLCLDCAQQLKDELAAQSQEAEAEIAAYAAALQRLQAEAGPAPPLAADAFAEALARARRELAEEEGRTAELERQLVAAEAEMSALQVRAHVFVCSMLACMCVCGGQDAGGW